MCLGTVQFGMNYGINNQIGRQPTWEESFGIFDYALENGIDIIDTARAYGEAELIIGEYLKRNPKYKNSIKIVSKLKPNCINGSDIAGTVERELLDTLKHIDIDFLNGYLLHTPEYILNKDIVNAMYKMKKKGLVKNIGVSVYDMLHGFAAIDTNIIDYIQLPYSIFDQRGDIEGFFYKAKKAGIKIFTRSAFLQGLFMFKEDKIPNKVIKSKPYLSKFNKLLMEYRIDKIDALLGFVKRNNYIDYLVFGVEKIEQLKEDMHRFESIDIPEDFYKEAEREFGKIEKSIIIPSLWSDGQKAGQDRL
jgi:Predicted oxidoreductases (related to aryl-alcohol dehydrogenases)